MNLLNSLADKAIKAVDARVEAYNSEKARVEALMRLGKPYVPPELTPDNLGWMPDPKRVFSGHWTRVPQNVAISHEPSNPESVEAMNRKLRQRGMTHTRVRIMKPMNLRGSKGQLLERGSVVDLEPLLYIELAGEENPRVEPVPDSVPITEIDRVMMPSDLAKAREIAAAELKKPADALSIADIWRFWATRKPKPNYVADIAEVLEK